MTKREHDLLQFIRAYYAEHGYSPNYTEMAAAISVRSKASISRLVQGLLDRSILRREGKIRAHRALIPVVDNGYERGFAEGYRAAVKEFGINLTRAA